VLCFGGDGTFNWVASTVLALRADGFPRFRPALVPCPLGTGNDLARALGWGATFPGFNAVPRFVSDAKAAPLGTEIDVWSVSFANSVRPPARRVSRTRSRTHTRALTRLCRAVPRQTPKLGTVQNYFSVGVDAEVSRRFDAARSANPQSFRSQISNKMRYGARGTQCCVRACMRACACACTENCALIRVHFRHFLVIFSFPVCSDDGCWSCVPRRSEPAQAPGLAAHRRR
jgi:diacylglycerol kinase (ATP)